MVGQRIEIQVKNVLLGLSGEPTYLEVTVDYTHLVAVEHSF